MRELVMITADTAIERLFLFDEIPELSLPRYELEAPYDVVAFIKNNGIHEVSVDKQTRKFDLPLQPARGSFATMARKLLKYALQNSKSEFLDARYGTIVCSNDTFPRHFPAILNSSLPQSCDKIWTESVIQIIRFSEAPQNTLFFIPEPEFFGMLGKKGNDVGGFCLSNFIVKVELEPAEINAILPEITYALVKVDE